MPYRKMVGRNVTSKSVFRPSRPVPVPLDRVMKARLPTLIRRSTTREGVYPASPRSRIIARAARTTSLPERAGRTASRFSVFSMGGGGRRMRSCDYPSERSVSFSRCGNSTETGRSMNVHRLLIAEHTASPTSWLVSVRRRSPTTRSRRSCRIATSPARRRPPPAFLRKHRRAIDRPRGVERVASTLPTRRRRDWADPHPRRAMPPCGEVASASRRDREARFTPSRHGVSRVDVRLGGYARLPPRPTGRDAAVTCSRSSGTHGPTATCMSR